MQPHCPPTDLTARVTCMHDLIQCASPGRRAPGNLKGHTQQGLNVSKAQHMVEELRITRGTRYSFSHTQTHSARIKVQVQVQRGPSGRSHTHSPFRHTSHSCPRVQENALVHSVTLLFAVRTAANTTHTKQGLNMPNVQHMVEECSHVVLPLVTEH